MLSIWEEKTARFSREGQYGFIYNLERIKNV